MRGNEARKLQDAFFKRLGPNARVFKELMDTLPGICLYFKDSGGRIMALNRRNCEVCNVKDETQAIGRTSAELFPSILAEDYIARDREVLKSGIPVRNRVSSYPADRSLTFMISNVYPLKDIQGKTAGTVCLYRLASEEETAPVWFGIFKTVTEFINQHYVEKIRIEDLAKRVHLSVSRFKHSFAETFKMSPGQYILVCRINAARKLLETTDKSITDIAQESGFWDHSHFIKTFKKMRGITPSSYRRQHQKIQAPQV